MHHVLFPTNLNMQRFMFPFHVNIAFVVAKSASNKYSEHTERVNIPKG